METRLIQECRWCGEAIERIEMNDGTLSESWQHVKPLDRLCCRTHKAAEPAAPPEAKKSLTIDEFCENLKNAGITSLASPEDKDATIASLRETISTLQGENQELRQVVKNYRDECYPQDMTNWGERCNHCIKADALLEPKPVAPDQPKGENR